MKKQSEKLLSDGPVWDEPLRQWTFLRFWEHIYPKVSKEVMSGPYIPAYSLWFKAFKLCPPDRVKVVIIGQDPYPNKEYAHGLAFSVPAKVKRLPPSLRIFLDELEDNLGVRPRNGDLSAWAGRGVLLLNRSLTTVPGVSAAHSKIGWDKLAYEVVRHLSMEREGIVFILLGKGAQELEAAVDATKHCVISAPHPSPLAAAGGHAFRGSRIFARAYEYNPELGPDYWRV